MSAYGKLAAPVRSSQEPLRPRVYALPERVRNDTSDPRAAVLCVPFSQKTEPKLPTKAQELLRVIFNKELDRGVTYPQYGPQSADEFSGYFLGYDLIVGVFLPALPQGLAPSEEGSDVTLADVLGADSLESLDWEKSLACFYYIKPNYPGRSSHICNAGFVVPDWNRGLGLGGLAGRSFLNYAPALGYVSSVFNLVYETNIASLAIWERLGFTKIGIIPGAGLLRVPDAKADEPKERYVDAWVIYCNFEERKQREEAASREVA